MAVTEYCHTTPPSNCADEVYSPNYNIPEHLMVHVVLQSIAINVVVQFMSVSERRNVSSHFEYYYKTKGRGKCK